MRAREAVFGVAGLAIGAVAGAALVATQAPDAAPAAAGVSSAAADVSARPTPAAGRDPLRRPGPTKRARRPPDPASGAGRRREPTQGPPPPPDAAAAADAPAKDDAPPAAPAPVPEPPASPVLPLADILAMCDAEDADPRNVYAAFMAWDQAARWDLVREIAAGRAPEILASPMALDCFVYEFSAGHDEEADAASAGVLTALARRIAGAADAEARAVAVDVARLCGPAGIDVVTGIAAADASIDVRVYALDALDEWEDGVTDAARRVILDCAESDDGELRWAAVEQLPLTGASGRDAALRLLRDGALPDDLRQPVAAAIAAADAVPEALEHVRDPEFASIVAESLAEAIQEGATGRRWFPSILAVPLTDSALDTLVNVVAETLGAAETGRIATDARCLPAARLRAFSYWAEDSGACPEAVTAALRAVRDPGAPALMRRELPSRIVEWASETGDDGETLRPQLLSESLRALRDAAARETNPWVRDAIRAALADAEDAE